MPSHPRPFGYLFYLTRLGIGGWLIYAAAMVLPRGPHLTSLAEAVKRLYSMWELVDDEVRRQYGMEERR